MCTSTDRHGDCIANDILKTSNIIFFKTLNNTLSWAVPNYLCHTRWAGVLLVCSISIAWAGSNERLLNSFCFLFVVSSGLPLPLCGFRSRTVVIAEVYSTMLMNVDRTMAIDPDTRMAHLLPEGKQYSYVAWYRVRTGLSDHEYEKNCR